MTKKSLTTNIHSEKSCHQMLTDLQFCLPKVRVLLVCYCILLHRVLQCVILSFRTRGAYYYHRKAAKNGNTPCHSLSFNRYLKELKVIIHVSPCLYQSGFVALQALSTAAFFCHGKLVIPFYCLLDS